MYKLPIDDHDDHKVNLYMDRWAEKATLVSEMDIEPYLKQNKEERKADTGIIRPVCKSGMGRKVASLPNIIVEKLMKEGIWGDSKAFIKWLNQADQKVFRTNTEYII